MHKIFYLLLFFFPFMATNAQIHEIGVFVGGSNYIGDVGLTTYVLPNEPAFGLLYKWNKSPRHSYRFSYAQTKITANDLDSKEPGRNQRGYRFENSIKEVSLGLEFNFFDFNLHDSKRKVSPYVYSGISFFRYDDLYVFAGETLMDKGSNSLAIPINLGVKSNVTSQIVLAFEIGARYTFTDNLDGSNPKNESLKMLQFGNINNNDWYVFSGLTVTYTFGNKPCYCAE
jgi:hypothetical protein